MMKIGKKEKKMLGKIKYFNKEKGYGFIETEKKDVFVHISEIDIEIGEYPEIGQQVEFETEDTEKGTKAVRVTLNHSSI